MKADIPLTLTRFEALAMQKPTKQFIQKILVMKSAVSLAYKKTEANAKFLQLELAAMELGLRLQEQLGDLSKWEKGRESAAFMSIAQKIRQGLQTILAMQDEEAKMIASVPEAELGKEEEEQDPQVSLFRLDAAAKFVSGLQLDIFEDFVGHAAVEHSTPLKEITDTVEKLCKGYLPEGEDDWHARAESVKSVKELLKLGNSTIVKCDGAALKEHCEKVKKDW